MASPRSTLWWPLRASSIQQIHQQFATNWNVYLTCICMNVLYHRTVGEKRERQRILAAPCCCMLLQLLASQHVSILRFLRHSLGPWVTTSTLCTRFASTSWATALEPQRIFLLMARSSAAWPSTSQRVGSSRSKLMQTLKASGPLWSRKHIRPHSFRTNEQNGPPSQQPRSPSKPTPLGSVMFSRIPTGYFPPSGIWQWCATTC